MTEDEARVKWCPMVMLSVSRADGGSSVSCNRVIDEDSNIIWSPSYCIASDCMAWRLDPPVKTAVDETNPFAGNEMRSLGGYCGLAGKP